MITILVGIASSIIAELVTWLNKQLTGTVLHGDGAFILATVIAIVAAMIKTYLLPVVTVQEFIAQCVVVWGASQLFFLGVVQMFDLDVQP